MWIIPVAILALLAFFAYAMKRGLEDIAYLDEDEDGFFDSRDRK